MTIGLTAYAAICAGLALAACSFVAPRLSAAIANAAMISAVGALFVVLLSLGDY